MMHMEFLARKCRTQTDLLQNHNLHDWRLNFLPSFVHMTGPYTPAGSHIQDCHLCTMKVYLVLIHTRFERHAVI